MSRLPRCLFARYALFVLRVAVVIVTGVVACCCCCDYVFVVAIAVDFVAVMPPALITFTAVRCDACCYAEGITTCGCVICSIILLLQSTDTFNYHLPVILFNA